VAGSWLILTKRLIFNNLYLKKNVKIMLNVLVLPCIQNQERTVGNINVVNSGEALDLLFAVL
jgi:hypothetical protein